MLTLLHNYSLSNPCFKRFLPQRLESNQHLSQPNYRAIMDGGTNFTITSYIVAKKISERLEGFEPSRTAWKAVMLAVEHHRRIFYKSFKSSKNNLFKALLTILVLCFLFGGVLDPQPHKQLRPTPFSSVKEKTQ